TCLSIDMLAAVLGVLLAIVVIPIGPRLYLASLGVQNAAVLIIVALTLVATRGITFKDIFLAVVPPCLAAAVGIGGVLGVRMVLGDPKIPFLHLAFEGISFALLYAAIIRVCWPDRLREILSPFPKAAGLRKVMLLV